MNLCKGCKKTEVRQRNRWERIRHFFFRWFEEEIKDLRGEKYTEGFGAGYKAGFEASQALVGMEQRTVEALNDLTKGLNRSLELPLTFDPSQVISVRKTPDGIKVFVGNEEASQEALTDLRIEASRLSESKLWSIMATKLKAMAQDKAINHSTKWEEVLAGKQMLHDVQIMESIVQALLETPSKS